MSFDLVMPLLALLPSCVSDEFFRSYAVPQFSRFRASQRISLEFHAASPLSSRSSRAPCIPSTSNSMARRPAQDLRRLERCHCRCSGAPDHRAQDARLKRDASRPEGLRLVGSEVVVLWRFVVQWTGGDMRLGEHALIFQMFDLKSQRCERVARSFCLA